MSFNRREQQETKGTFNGEHKKSAKRNVRLTLGYFMRFALYNKGLRLFQTVKNAVFVYQKPFGCRLGRKSRHSHDIACNHYSKTGAK